MSNNINSNDINHQVDQHLKEIKQSFRLIMNGITAESMRQKGVIYKLNWGASIMDLQKMAEEILHSRTFNCHETRLDYYEILAEKMWNTDTRECKLLATMIMPKERMTLSKAQEWTATIDKTELSEALSHYLLQHTCNKKQLYQNLINSQHEYSLLCGLHILYKYISQTEDSENKEQTIKQMESIANNNQNSLAIRKAATTIINKLYF